MAIRSIPDDVQKQVSEIVEGYNRERLAGSERRYVPRFKGRHLYLDREEFGRPCPICRLAYTGNMKKWGFAIYKYSRDRYDPEEWMFPGSGCVDGTVRGALEAGTQAYP